MPQTAGTGRHINPKELIMLDYDVPTVITIKVPQGLHDIDYTTSSVTSSENMAATLQDLQAMKQMVHDIYRSPDLFLEHSPVYVQNILSDDAQRFSQAQVQAFLAKTSIQS